MGKLAETPGPGACTAELGGQSRILKIRLAEIERFEDRHPRGFYAFFDALRGEGGKPTIREVRDLIALALVGGGMDDKEADKVMDDEGPEEMYTHLLIARDIMMATIVPSEEDRKMLEEGEEEEEPGNKKKQPKSKSAD